MARLGDNAGPLLNTYLTVSKVVDEEILASFQGAGDLSDLGKLQLWTNNLPKKLMQKALALKEAVGEAGVSMTTDRIGGRSGRCKCGNVKGLKFKWKETQGGVEYPSFFGVVLHTTRWMPIDMTRQFQPRAGFSIS